MQSGFGKVAFVGDLPLVVDFDQHRAGSRSSEAGLGKTPTTSVRRLTSLLSRSSGFVLLIFSGTYLPGPLDRPGKPTHLTAPATASPGAKNRTFADDAGNAVIVYSSPMSTIRR